MAKDWFVTTARPNVLPIPKNKAPNFQSGMAPASDHCLKPATARCLSVLPEAGCCVSIARPERVSLSKFPYQDAEFRKIWEVTRCSKIELGRYGLAVYSRCGNWIGAMELPEKLALTVSNRTGLNIRTETMLISYLKTK